MAAEEGEKKKIEIYPSSSSSAARQVTPFWKEKYERDAKKYWDVFYRRHKDKFFKDRHYFDKEWGNYFKAQEGEKLVILEVGCGAGNSIFPLVSTYPDMFVHACDFSPRAIDLVKAHKDFASNQINPFVCDLTVQNLSDVIQPSSVDIVTMVFVLSAVSPEKMPLVLQNIRKVLKPNGRVLLRDYATGDLAQARLTSKEQEISDNFYVRGDGTRAYYFSEDFLSNLFIENGFDVEELGICNKQVENRSLELVMKRRWIQAVFSLRLNASNSAEKLDREANGHVINKNAFENPANNPEIDLSESIIQIFDVSLPIDEVIEIKVRGHAFRIKALPREYQHTCKSTGLMLWESARFMCNLLAENPSVTSGKRVLELGCGSTGICSMISVAFAELVVCTDGDVKALKLLHENIMLNANPGLIQKMVVKKLMWGNKEDIMTIRELGDFNLIIGTDVTYYAEAISPLFETASALIANNDTETRSGLVLCHMQRRVDEDCILSAAAEFGFKLVDKWINGINPNLGIICSWFSNVAWMNEFKNVPLCILYFEVGA